MQFTKRPKSQISGRWWTLFFISICKFSKFVNHLATITSLSELSLRFRWFILLVQIKKVISMNFDISTSSWKVWRRVTFHSILQMRIYWKKSLLKKTTGSSRTTDFKDILLWNISQMITKTLQITKRIFISYVMK